MTDCRQGYVLWVACEFISVDRRRPICGQGSNNTHLVRLWIFLCQNGNIATVTTLLSLVALKGSHGDHPKSNQFLQTLQWRHNGHDNVSNHQPHDCLLNCLFRRRSKKTSKLRVTGLCAGNHRGPVNSPHKWPLTRKMFPFDDVIMRRHITSNHWDRVPHIWVSELGHHWFRWWIVAWQPQAAWYETIFNLQGSHPWLSRLCFNFREVFKCVEMLLQNVWITCCEMILSFLHDYTKTLHKNVQLVEPCQLQLMLLLWALSIP